jgi:hypothetical protein
MPDWEKIGLVMQTVGDRMSGKDRGAMDRVKGLSTKRKKAMVEDVDKALTLIKNGNVTKARTLLMNRNEAIGRLGGDNSSTQEAINAIDSSGGDIDKLHGLIDDMTMTVEEGRKMGLLPSDELVEAKDGQGLYKTADGRDEYRPIAGYQPPEKSDEHYSASTIKYKNGTFVMGGSQGSTRVTLGDGTRVTGQAARDAITAGRESGIADSGAASKARAIGGGQGKNSQEIAKDTYERAAGVRKNIGNWDRVVAAIDNGADTGVIASKFPSFTQASIELDNIRNQLGLDIIGATTFGALSEGELEFALDTALPTDMDEKDLREWAIRKKASQERVLTELLAVAKFYSLGGTIHQWAEMQEKKRKPEQRSGAGEEDDTMVNH